MRLLVSILVLGLVSYSCAKKDSAGQPSDTSTPAHEFSELRVVPSFNWSSSEQGIFRVSFSADSSVSLKGAEVWVVDSANRVLERKTLRYGEAEFYLNFPQIDTKLYYYLPRTREKWAIENATTSIKLSNPFNLPLVVNKTKSGKKSHHSSSGNLLGNAGFETDDFTYRSLYSSSQSHIDDGKWYTYGQDVRLENYNGSQSVTGKKRNYSYLYQAVSVNAGDSLYMSADMYGSGIAYVLFYNSVGSLTSYHYEYPSGNSVSYAGVVPSGCTAASVLFYFNNNVNIDNAYLSNPPAIIDSDYDGVPDDQDAFPNDMNRAYISQYPTTGTQTLAFEDLWPSRGDYDFNDMVITAQIEFVKNASNHFVEANVWVSLDARGAGAENGLGLLLVNSSKSAFNQNMINAVNGDATLDPNNNNGIIVWSRPGDIQSSNYTNTTTGNFATPDTAHFTITFKSNATVAAIIPDFYLFRSNQRGREIHLPGFSGTAAADASLYNTFEDVNGTYRTVEGLPWAIELTTTRLVRFKHTMEKEDILFAYPQFEDWAESNGQQNVRWYENPLVSKVVDLGSL